MPDDLALRALGQERTAEPLPLADELASAVLGPFVGVEGVLFQIHGLGLEKREL